ncbi:hypothetical protein [Propionivibrio sp.]|uniref:hypothetical protein n=1 Tax=Propionivibrio sp. TaxID=2212460 RepID=UPI0039E2978C
MVFDFLKHLTTLSSGSILLILALIEKFANEPHLSQSLFRSAAAFCVAILSALVAMAVVAFSVGGEKPSSNEANVLAWGFTIAGVCFFFGIMLVGLTVLRISM